ncbi:hypothetical protein MTR67_001977 [Solanum verrucosum]|uniref:non-specific serine/threonine protein kinase n=1 Tax=Solanum verrucosum TaxID=315347 RepID=A0AAF0PPL1_SOLVR|nr:hypothetical protein MTR67_001977 [Solanum verrucosum]
MPNGSSNSGLLDWPMRYKIAMDAAEGLSYWRHDSTPPRDVKSNNILLDGEFADFGVANAVDANASMSVIARSCGYIAPDEVHEELWKVASYAPAYSMNDEFSRVLHQQMEFFSKFRMGGIADGGFRFQEYRMGGEFTYGKSVDDSNPTTL